MVENEERGSSRGQMKVEFIYTKVKEEVVMKIRGSVYGKLMHVSEGESRGRLERNNGCTGK